MEDLQNSQWYDGKEWTIVLLVVLGLVTGLLWPVVGAVFVVLLGVLSNVVLRVPPNVFNWRYIPEGLIWFVIAYLALAPLLIALSLFVTPLLLAWLWGIKEFMLLWVFLLAYPFWLAGYIWAWTNPKLQIGTADVVMVSAPILAQARMRMWWLLQKLRLGSWIMRV